MNIYQSTQRHIPQYSCFHSRNLTTSVISIVSNSLNREFDVCWTVHHYDN